MGELKEILERLTERIAAERQRILSQAQRPGPKTEMSQRAMLKIHWRLSTAHPYCYP